MSGEDDPYFDPEAEQREHAKQQARADAREFDRRGALASITEDQAGRLFLWELLSTCGVWSASYGEHMAFREGQRDIGIRVMREIEAIKPGILHEMSYENSQREFRYQSITGAQTKET